MSKWTGILLVFSVLIAGQTIQAQDKNDNQNEKKETQYLFSGKNDINVSGFGAPIFEFSSAQGNFAFGAGGGGAVLFNKRFYIGGYGIGMMSMNELDFKIHSIHGTISYPHLLFGHGGFWLGYIHNPENVVHFSLSTKIGFGGISYTNDLWDQWYDESDWGYDRVFVFTPQAEVEINLLKWFKINAGLGYRLVSGIDNEFKDSEGNPAISNNDMSSIQGSLSFIFGWF